MRVIPIATPVTVITNTRSRSSLVIFSNSGNWVKYEAEDKAVGLAKKINFSAFFEIYFFQIQT